MPDGHQQEAGIGLALSGGGFRATLFHIGSLWRLNELGYLPQLTRICSVSGGSITAGLLGIRWKNLQFDEKGIATNFESEIAKPLQDFCSQTIDVSTILGGWLSIFSRPSDKLIARYDNDLFQFVNGFNEAATAVSDWSLPETALWLRQQGVSHLFIGARGGFMPPEALQQNPEMRLIYGRDGVFIFELLGE